jgi:hypothetical protein
MADASSTFSLREFLQLLVPPLVALSLFTPWYSPLQGKLTIEGILFAGVVIGLLFSGPADALSIVVTRLIPFPSYRRRRNQVDATGRLMRKSVDFERLETHLTKDDRELADILGSLSICYRQTAMYLVFFVLLNVYSLWHAVSESPRLLALVKPVADSPGMGSAIAAWKALGEPASPMLGGWQLPTILAIAASVLAIVFLLEESIGAKDALFGVQGLYNGYALKFQKTDPDIALAVWGKVVLESGRSEPVLVQLTVHASRGCGDSSRTSAKTTDVYGLFCFPLTATDRLDGTKYEVSVDAADTVTVARGTISGLLVIRRPPAKKVGGIRRVLRKG